ncbi:MAG: PRC-barrel domain-containing protein [Allorhizobium sp.]
MNKHFTMIAAGILLGSSALSPVMAQTAVQPTAPAADGLAPKTDTMAPATTTAATPAMSGEYLTMQSPTQVSANSFIGTSVYNTANESIGEINDLIMEENGGIVAAVVGVGGFLGLGEKDVAVPMDKITITREADGNDLKLTTSETAELLKAAPEFKTLDDQRAAADSKTVMPADSTTTSSTTVKP